jgi:hypothetical protein
MSDLLLPAVQKGSVATVDTDPYYNLVSLHLKGDVNTGRNYNAFSDASSNNFRLTNNGDVRGSSFSPYGTSWSNYFSGVSDFLSYSTITLGASFTIEFFVYFPTTPSANAVIISNIGAGGTNWVGVSNTAISLSYSAGTRTFAFTPAGGTWYYVQLINSASSLTCYVNGTQVGTAQTGPSSFTLDRVGGYTNVGFTGYLSSVRVNSTALAVSALPTSPLTEVANTVLLTCQSNRLLDNRASPLTLTKGGSLSVSSFSPFLETDTTTGSGYFDGNADYLDVTSALFNPAGAFTVEFWFYGTDSATSTQGLISTWASGLSPAQGILIWKTGANCEIQIGNASTGGTTIATFTWATYLNQWNHFALVRNSSNSCTVFLNGIRLAAPVTKSGSPGQTALTIGRAFPNSASSYFAGYMSNVSFVSGSSLYDPALTTIPVPTLPITKVTDTALLTLQERGAYNTIGFQDESEYQHLITRNGNVAQGTFSPFSNAGWAVSFGGGASNINLASSADFALGGAFSFECWVYQTSIPNFVDLLDVRTSNEVGSLGISATGFPRWQNGPTTGSLITGSTALTLNQWNYLLFVADASGCSIYLNGQRIANTAQVATWPSSARPCFIGGSFGNASGGSLSGFIADARLIKGSTPYSSTATSVTVPTALLPFVTNTVLQCCRTNRFANTVNSASMTANGTTSVAPFSPFKPVAYDPAVHGGSGYFDGTTDNLAVVSPQFTLGTDNLTAECWFYPTAAGNSSTILACKISAGAGFYLIWSSTSAFRVLVNAGAVWSVDASSAALNLNTWNHLVMTRDGSTIRTFLNGVLATVTTGITGSMGATAPIVRIGSDDAGSGVVNASYITGVRIVKGVVYPTSLTTTGTQVFTPPNAPAPVINNTLFLLNFTNGGVIDSTGKNVIETVGNAGVVTTTIKKFGSGSMFFDGTGDYDVIPLNKQMDFSSSGSITIEFWMYGENTSRAFVIGSNAFSGSTSNYSAGIMFDWTPGVSCFFGAGRSTGLNLGAGVTANTWHHVAFCYNGATGTNYVFLNGNLITSSVSSSAMTQTAALLLGVQGSDRILPYKGYIDDLRITSGLARYTANFTPPTKALPDRGTTSTLTSDLAAPASVEALVVGGGGGGGGRYAGGGGGGGGFQEFVGGSALPVSAGANYPISVGLGGAGGAANNAGQNGGNSVFSNITSTGGGGGGSSLDAGPIVVAGNGGSGGGGSWRSVSQVGTGGTGIAGQGYAGQTGLSNGTIGGGGGGAGEAGGTDGNGYGGDGLQSSITGVATFYAGGGGGGNQGTATPYQRPGGDGGGGVGAIDAIGGAPSTIQATAGTPNTGGGGGAGCWNNTPSGAAGGSGVVIVAYPTSFRPLKASLGLVYTIDTVTRPGYRVYRFTSGSGSISW